MVARKASSAVQRDARELAVTPVPNPYRGQLADPYLDQPVPDDVVLTTPRGLRPAFASAPVSYPANFASTARAPKQAVLAGVLGFVMGSAVGLFGLMLVAILSFRQYSTADRSFHRGNDASYLVLAVLDFALAAACIAGAVWFLSGRVSGRITLTVFGWTVLGLSFFWWHSGQAPFFVPVVVGLTAAVMLVVLYHATVTRWLGVLPASQPQ